MDLKFIWWPYSTWIGFWDGKKTDLSQYTRVLTQDDIDNFEENKTATETTNLTLHYTLASKGSTIYDKSGNGNHWTVNTSDLVAFWSTYDGRPDNVLDGFTKKLVNTTAGTSYIASTQAYGVWEVEFSWNLSNIQRHFFIEDSTSIVWTNGYHFYIHSDGSVRLYEYSGSSVLLFETTAWYISSNTQYVARIFRNSVVDEFVTWAIWTFAVYLKWGIWSDYTLIDVTGGSWTNPVTNNTHTTSAYQVLDFDVWDSVKNLKTGDSVENLALVDMFDFTDDTGVYEQVRVPALEGSTTLDAEGSELSNPPCVGHNDAESLLQMPEVIPSIYQIELDNWFEYWYDSTGTTLNKISYDDIEANYNDLNIYFADTSTYCKKNFLMYEEPISWRCLDKTLGFSKDQFLRDESGQKILDENDDPILIN